jgi:hypothetical protein
MYILQTAKWYPLLHSKYSKNKPEIKLSIYLNDDKTSLFNCFNKIVPLSIEYIFFGCNEISEELNTLLFKSVHKFIRQTCIINKLS